MRHLFDTMLVDLLGIKTGSDEAGADMKPFEGAVDLLMDIRKNAKDMKDWATSDLIRDKLSALGFNVKDTKQGVEWSLK